MKVGIYARVSTQKQQTPPLQIKDLREFAKRRKWKVEIEISEVASGAKIRPKCEELFKKSKKQIENFRQKRSQVEMKLSSTKEN